MISTDAVIRTSVIATLALLAGACSGDDAASYEQGEELAGGETTVFETGGTAFSLAARNLKGARRDDFFVGNAFFKRNWVTAPASTSGQDGLGPTFNATACAACHFMDGRGAPPQEPDEAFLGLLVRLSVPGTDAHGGPLDEPNYGGQFNHHAVLGVPAEGGTHVAYVEAPGQFDDGTPYSLRVPTYTFSDLAFGAMAPDVMTSPRTANAMIGLGLLQAVTEDGVLAFADENDADGDGISGRPNRVWDPIAQDRAARPVRLEGEPARCRAAGLGRVPRRHRHHVGAAPAAELSRGADRVCRRGDRRRAGGRCRTRSRRSRTTRGSSRCPRAAT